MIILPTALTFNTYIFNIIKFVIEGYSTTVIIILTVIGYVVGALLFSDRDKIKDWMDKILPPGRFR